MKAKNIFEIIESYYFAKLLTHLQNLGAFRNPRKKKLIKDFFPDKEIFHVLNTRTDIFEIVDDSSFVISPQYDSYMDLGIYIDKFLEAYGQFDSKGKYPLILTDQKKFANAFQSAAAFQTHDTILAILSALKITNLLDLGCGAGGLLVQFCKVNKLNRGIGIDQNPWLCKIAGQLVKKTRIMKRARIINGNVTKFDKLLSATELNTIGAVFGASIFNEFFRKPAELIGLLKKLNRHFAGKFLVISDYYGCLDTAKADKKAFQHNYIHDLMQILTGQGLPPKNSSQWNTYYRQAGCNLAYVYEGTENGINCFIHIVKLKAIHK